MEDVKTPQQMAAVWDDLDQRCNDATLKAIGEPGSWAVALAYHSSTEQHHMLFLASARKPTRMREFKTLDAAMNAGIEVEKMRKDRRHASDYARMTVQTRIVPLEGMEEVK